MQFYPAVYNSNSECTLRPHSWPNSGVFCLFLGHTFTWGPWHVVSVSKDGKDKENSRNYVTWGMAEGTKDVYSGRRFKEIQNHFKPLGQFFFSQKEMQYTLSSFRDMAWRHDWDLRGGELGSTKWSTRYRLQLPYMECDTSMSVTALSLGYPSKGGTEIAPWVFGNMYSRAPRAAPMMQLDIREGLNTVKWRRKPE